MTVAAQTEKEAAKAAAKAKEAADLAEEKRLNEGRTGKGTRATVGYTRGKGSQRIIYESFDESQPDTLPTSLDEFMSLSKVRDEAAIVSLLIDGFNSLAYSNASDPVGEFANPAWDAETTTRFKNAVKNYVAATGTSVEDAAALIRPGIDKAQSK